MLNEICSTALLVGALLASIHGRAFAADAQAMPPPEPVHLDQGWTPADWHNWYTTSQGSRLLPSSWISALEQADSSEKFLSEANVRRFGYLSYPANRTGLPLGFAVDTGPAPDGSAEPWAGMTCAACHTGDITYRGSRIRIDGAPTQADFQTFMESLRASLQATWSDSPKFVRFASAVLGASASAHDKEKLKNDLDKQRLWYTQLMAKNAAPVRYGHARLDAQGYILNKISLAVGAQQQDTDFPSDAPASYPFLWNAPRQSVVQWNGIVPQGLVVNRPGGGTFDLLAMIRNTTEVIGVFATVDVRPSTSYPSSLRFDNVISLENLMKGLKPPKWPETIFPKIDIALRNRGKTVFTENHCQDCHQVFDSASPPDTITIKMTPLKEIGTDIWLACNTFLHHSKSGLLEGRPDSPFNSDPIKPDDRTFNLLTNMSFGMVAKFLEPQALPRTKDTVFVRLAGQPPIAATPPAASGSSGIPDPVKERRRQTCLAAAPDHQDILAYEPRPLNGIWATAPYLHNGSVPTLYDLLRPGRDRPPYFTVGGTEFDPDKVGFKSGPEDGPFGFHVRDHDGNPILGNSNIGHEYGTNLTEEDRKALVEYLKTL